MSNIRRWSIPLIVSGALALGCDDSSDVETRISLAKLSIERAEYATASLELANVLQVEPHNRDVRVLLAKVSLASGRADVAERHLRAAEVLGRRDAELVAQLGRALLAQAKFEDILLDTESVSDDPAIRVVAATLRGTAELHLGRPTLAENALRRALASDASYMPARVALARAYLSRGDSGEAERLLHEAIRDDPLSVHAQQALGALRYGQQRYAEAERAFSDAIALSAGLDEADELMLAHVGLIEAQWRVGKRAKAMLNAKDLLDNHPWHPLPRYLRALLAFDDRDYALATEHLDAVLRMAPNHHPSHQLTAAASFAQGRLGLTQMHLESFLAEAPDDADMIRLMADTYLRMGNAHQALATLRPIKSQHDHAHALELYGTASLHAGALDEAIEFFRAAVAREPDDLRLQTRLVAALLNAGKAAQADRIMSDWPTTLPIERARTLLRLLRFLRGASPQRTADYAKRRRREDPSDLLALLALAESAERGGERGQALSWLEIARTRNPAALEPRLLLADYALRMGENDKLRQLAEEMLAVQPYNGAALAYLGEAHLAAGDASFALATFRDALRVAPDSSAHAFNLARAQFAIGDFWSASETVFAALAEDPQAIEQVAGLIVEEQRRGNGEQARALAEQLQSRYAEHPAGFTIAGDLYMLQRQYAAAAAAYAQAQRRQPTRELALKVFTAGLAAGNAKATAALSDWLATNPNDAQFARIVRAVNGGV